MELNATTPLAGTDTQALLTLLSCPKKLKLIARLFLGISNSWEGRKLLFFTDHVTSLCVLNILHRFVK